MGGEPLRFRLGAGSVIKGLDQVLLCAILDRSNTHSRMGPRGGALQPVLQHHLMVNGAVSLRRVVACPERGNPENSLNVAGNPQDESWGALANDYLAGPLLRIEGLLPAHLGQLRPDHAGTFLANWCQSTRCLARNRRHLSCHFSYSFLRGLCPWWGRAGEGLFLRLIDNASRLNCWRQNPPIRPLL